MFVRGEPIYQFEQECQAELDRLAQRRRAVMDAMEALSEELAGGIHRCKDAGMPMSEIAQRLGISRQRAYVYLQAEHRRGRRSAE